ncbi:MAG: glycosyltransferase family 4 protein [Candidatus Eremiobacteraeota bacterium]|nr:glycosyltransferase family 4 protein [Candidatus Eremiobacteraeota bacterium]MBC5801675.1 glycosyltransferase family 4 protein [Candidatus Eremiobacteraeota bacterium]MBC5824043.1 glycosyltransferase family 4 protein [Candidatus Eremiobacteraeota bacterium]
MRVLFVTQTGASLGGAEHSLLLLLQHLTDDVQSSVLLFEDGAYAERLRKEGFPVDVVEMPAELLAVRRENLLRPQSAKHIFQAVSRTRRRIAAAAPDVVHTNSIKAHFLAGLAARIAGVPVVMHFRDFLPGLGRFALALDARTLASKRIACSHAVAAWYPGGPTETIANPIDVAAYNDLPERDVARKALGLEAGLVIGIVGRINRWKGHDRFLRIAARVNREIPITIAVVGEARFRDADFVPELRALARSLGIVDRVHFLPWQEDPRIAYAALDVHCNCSDREPFGRTTAEAALAGVPTVTFDDGGASDIIEDRISGRLVRSGDEGAFAEAVLEYLQDAPLRRRAGEAARTAASRFDPATHARRVAEVLTLAARSR